jgi:hypothetical protein
MNALSSAIRELWGLFVEDPSFTLGMLVCVVAARFLFPLLRVPLPWRAGVFFALLAVVLAENIWRSAKAADSRRDDHLAE